MSERKRIGDNLGTTGYFLSRPGDNVAAPTKSLLVDSRFPLISIHAQGRFRLSRWFNEATRMSLFYGEVGFTDLGFVPFHTFSFIYGDANSLGVPPNTAYYPSSWSGQDTGNMTGNWDMTENSVVKFRESGCWIAGQTVLRAKAFVETSNDLNIQLQYTIFKNRRGV